jgi:cytochrome c oxidase assembly protein subunit 15
MLPSSNTLFKGSLMTLLFMIMGMVILGGLTRLTGSGLSIVEWKPVTGILPPLTLQGWMIEFQKYQVSPEFLKINQGMTLSDFQSIFWLEYMHRLWGRLIGLVLLIPTYLLIFRKQYRELWSFLALLWLLGAGQGIMGWIMVKSGLSHDPYVSPYLLAAHLLLGMSIFMVTLWMILSLYRPQLQLERQGYSKKAVQSLKGPVLLGLLSALLTAFWGALVAGLKAGLLYNTFPLMGDSLIPPEFLNLSPWWRDLLENPPSVQFIHRLLAFLTTGLCTGIWFYQRRLLIPPRLSYAFHMLLFFIILQVSLGITTLVLHVPISFAILHQGMAFLLVGSLMYAVFLVFSFKNTKTS